MSHIDAEMTAPILSSSMSLAHIAYRYPISHIDIHFRYLIDVRIPISISHIDTGSYLVTLSAVLPHQRGDARLSAEAAAVQVQHPGNRARQMLLAASRDAI